MSTPFDRGPARGDDGRDDFAPRIAEDEQAVDALLRAGGEQWRAEVPVVEFDRPSSRVALLGRGARITATIGIAAAVVAIVLAGSALIDRPATSPGTGSVPTSAVGVPSGVSSAGSPAGSPIGPIRDFASAEDEKRQIEFDRTTPQERLGQLMTSDIPPVAGDVSSRTPYGRGAPTVWAGWDVSTGQLLVAVTSGGCDGDPIGMELIGPQRLRVTFTAATGACLSIGVHFASFRAPSGMDQWSDATLITPFGTGELAGMGGIVDLPTADDESSGAELHPRDGATDSTVRLTWNATTRRLVIRQPLGIACTGPVVGATSADRGSTIDLVTGYMSTGSCAVGPETATSVLRLPPSVNSAPFGVRWGGRVWRVA